MTALHGIMRSNLHILLLIMICVNIMAVVTTPVLARPVSSDLGKEVDAYIRETMKRLPIPGLAVGIVKEDQVLYLQGYGTANADGDPVTPQTPFMLASVTKTFTALAVQQLARDGTLDIESPVQDYIPEFRLADRYGGSTVTVRHLLEHTSGISTIEGTQPYLQSSETKFDEALKQLARYSPKTLPGEHYEYSNWNHVLLGEVISRASGQPYAEYVQEHVLVPLEMSQSTFADHHSVPGVATGNLIVFGASFPYDEPHLPVMLSAGYLTSTAEDMTHYLVAFLDHGQYHERAVLSGEGRGWYDTSWYWHKGIPGDISYGFSGGHNSINTNIQMFPLHRVGVVILMNTRLDQLIPGPMVNDIAFNIARLTIGSPHEVPSAGRFYTGYALLDVFLLLLIAGIIWQAFALRNWRQRYLAAARPKRFATWAGIILDLLICIIVLFLPILANSRWNILLHFRPDFAIPVLAVGISFGVLGLIKIAGSIRPSAPQPPAPALRRVH